MKQKESLAVRKRLKKSKVSYELDDGEKLNKEYPDTFFIPTKAVRDNIQPETNVKLIFHIKDNGSEVTERMWVQVKGRMADHYIGLLNNQPLCPELRPGTQVIFKPEHIIDIWDMDSDDLLKAEKEEDAAQPVA